MCNAGGASKPTATLSSTISTAKLIQNNVQTRLLADRAAALGAGKLWDEAINRREATSSKTAATIPANPTRSRTMAGNHSKPYATQPGDQGAAVRGRAVQARQCGPRQIGADLDAQQWRGVLRQLVATGLLGTD